MPAISDRSANEDVDLDKTEFIGMGTTKKYIYIYMQWVKGLVIVE